MLNIIIKICDQTFPLAANINDVTPIIAAINVKISKLCENKFEIIIIVRDSIQNPHSVLVKF